LRGVLSEPANRSQTKRAFSEEAGAAFAWAAGPGLEFGRFRRLFPGFALVARGSSRSDVLKVVVWLQPTGGAPRISIASRSDACYTQRVHATVSKSQDAQVKAYISKQRQHHRKKNFQEEYRALLDRHEIQYDERHLWD
jgi:hypothetical protein